MVKEFLVQSRKLKGCFAGGGADDAVAQAELIIGKDAAALAASGNGDIELFPVHGPEGAGGGDHEDLVNGFTLRGVGSDGVTVAKGTVVPWEKLE
jgi:hypothetical protein